MNKLDAFANEQLKESVPEFNVGDTVKVHNRIKEGTKERIQMFEGTVIGRHGGGISETFTVRRVAYGCGVEKSNYAYKRNVDDPIFNRTGGLTQYTNVLVGFTDAQCKPDLAMRPYAKLVSPDGEVQVIYGGTVHRSIGYIAYQNRDAFQTGTAEYTYIHKLIDAAYAG